MSTVSDLPFQLQLRLLDDALDGIVIVDQQSLIRYVNRSMEVLTGFSRSELYGRSLDVLIPDDGISPHSEKIAKFMTGGRPSAILGHVRELQILLRSGETCAVEMKAVDLGSCNSRRFFGAFMSDIRERKSMEARNAGLLALLEQQALSDSLTGLLNRRAFEKEAIAAVLRSARSSAPITVGIADVDHFKNINDQYGHAVGDALLKAVAAAMRSVARDTDIVARMGGEEFGLLFPNASIEQARQAAERIREAVALIRLPLDDKIYVQVTISIGLSRLVGCKSVDQALVAADQALYSAKNKGRNRIEVSDG
ncbi:diguanylate cyclase [Duganella sp. FT135W]|uniref:diguanylate cyclase n=1 Tax=Duganella flavida TaxID=2692175 RepID=A0A6L8K5H8_9BURK|nr:sensor domain-containing diguanylate cyclase [Duganella flavida]MYM22636.1 diguanylate cyclase [Duganella flavida]